MKIYTKTGDAGETSLFGGKRLSKSHARIEAYGLADQLNAQLGITRLHVEDTELDELLHRVQSELFNLGADLATPLHVKSDYVVRMTQDEIANLEGEIDQLEEDLPPLKTFILPGGSAAAAHLHMARTICRQVERTTVYLTEREPVNQHALVYLNRLSDWLFVLARVANHRQSRPDVAWVSPASLAKKGETADV